jgi:hypothetical protein
VIHVGERILSSEARWLLAVENDLGKSMKTQYGPSKLVACVIALAMAAGCASTEVSNRQQLVSGNLARPTQIWVYDFAATPADVSPESTLAGQPSDYAETQTTEEIAEGRKLGSAIAAQLVREIHAMGMPAATASAATRPQLSDLVIEGSLLSVQPGSAAARVGIGFTAGQSELKVAVEVFQMTTQGLRKLGSADVGSAGNRTPGVGVGLATMIATRNPAGLIISGGMKVYGEKSGSNTMEGRTEQTVKEISAALKRRFQEQGWISSNSNAPTLATFGLVKRETLSRDFRVL